MNEECLIHLDYETRNLGIPCYALTANFLNNPDREQLSNTLNSTKKHSNQTFVQARVVPEQFATLTIIEASGFTFVETTLDPYTVLGKNSVLQHFLKDRSTFVPKRFSATNLKLVHLDQSDQTTCEAVKTIAAESFIKDRFHVDPRCPDSLADKRFVYWVEDLLKANTLFHILLYNDEVIGFMVRNEQHLVLAGFSRKYSASGFGDYLWLSVLADMVSEGLTQAHTRISVNNIPVLNLYVRLGFKFRDPAAMFHYWHGDSTNS